MEKRQIVYIDLDEIQPYEKNPRNNAEAATKLRAPQVKKSTR